MLFNDTWRYHQYHYTGQEDCADIDALKKHSPKKQVKNLNTHKAKGLKVAHLNVRSLYDKQHEHDSVSVTENYTPLNNHEVDEKVSLHICHTSKLTISDFNSYKDEPLCNSNDFELNHNLFISENHDEEEDTFCCPYNNDTDEVSFIPNESNVIITSHISNDEISTTNQGDSRKSGYYCDKTHCRIVSMTTDLTIKSGLIS